MATAPKLVEVRDYGCRVKGKDQLFYDRWAFANKVPVDKGAPPRVVLFKQMADALAPKWFEWHSWTDKVVDTLCHEQFSGITGCGGSAKTRNVTGFACAWWMANPRESSVILCSTTMKMLRKRAWAEVQAFYYGMGQEYGNMVDSRTLWQYEQGDDKHAIFGIAVREGNITQVADGIKGIHTRRQMVVIDEATAVPAAIWDACTNLYGYPDEFILVAVANARSRIDRFGRWIEPKNGWDSVSVDTEEWEGKPQLNGKKVAVIRLDFKKSPNITEGKLVSRHLPTKERVEARLAALKERGAENDPLHWSNDRGFPPPEGMMKTVLTDSLIAKYDGGGRHQFTGNGFRIIAGFDQAFGGGARPALRFATMGEIRPNVMGIELMPAILLYIDATCKDPVRYQLLSQLRRHCSAVNYRGSNYICQPGDLGIDDSGDGGLGDICHKEWSSEIIRVQFGGAASDQPCSLEDNRPANQVYRNKRAEMHFRVAGTLVSGQLKGIDPETAREFCQLQYEDYRADGTAKPITIEDKKEYKLRYEDESPDLSDSSCVALEVARIKGFRLVATGNTITRFENIGQMAAKSQAVFHDITYSEEERPEEVEEEEPWPI